MDASEVARVVIAVAVAVTLAVLGAHPRVFRRERRLGLTVLASSGFPFLLLGIFFRELDVLTPRVIADMRPLFEFGLGWVGLSIGTNPELRRFALVTAGEVNAPSSRPGPEPRPSPDPPEHPIPDGAS